VIRERSLVAQMHFGRLQPGFSLVDASTSESIHDCVPTQFFKVEERDCVGVTQQGSMKQVAPRRVERQIGQTSKRVAGLVDPPRSPLLHAPKMLGDFEKT
jgi:hypothetical protein